ncbi:hypothetical protein C8R44DRAFT_871641 [Mycena epipterygia]|nr:hypothetical protein C8R44DRAFT_871641 [Mycena epipterygia]
MPVKVYTKGSRKAQQVPLGCPYDECPRFCPLCIFLLAGSSAPPVGNESDTPYNGAPSSHISRSSSPSPARVPSSSSYAPSSPHMKFDPKATGHDRPLPPSSNSYPTSSSPSSLPADEMRVRYDRGTHQTEKGLSGEWVTGMDGSGKGVQSMDDVARRLRGLRLR